MKINEGRNYKICSPRGIRVQKSFLEVGERRGETYRGTLPKRIISHCTDPQTRPLRDAEKWEYRKQMSWERLNSVHEVLVSSLPNAVIKMAVRDSSTCLFTLHLVNTGQGTIR